MTSFASLADIEALLGRDFAAEEPASAQLALDLATAAIRNYTRQQITEVVDDQITLHGNTSRRLTLPERPVISVAAVGINGITVGPNTYLLVRDELWWGVRALSVANATDDLGYGWGTRSTPVTVTYTHGYATVPDDIRAVCVYLAFRAFQQPLPITEERIGGYQVMYGKIAEGALELTAFEQRLLAKYRRTWQ